MDASGINPVASMMVSYAVFVRLVSVSSDCSAIVSVFVMASCSAVLEVRWHPKACGICLCRMWYHICILFGLVDDG